MANEKKGSEPNDGTNQNKERQRDEEKILWSQWTKSPRVHQGRLETRPPWTSTTARMIAGDAGRQY